MVRRIFNFMPLLCMLLLKLHTVKSRLSLGLFNGVLQYFLLDSRKIIFRGEMEPALCFSLAVG